MSYYPENQLPSSYSIGIVLKDRLGHFATLNFYMDYATVEAGGPADISDAGAILVQSADSLAIAISNVTNMNVVGINYTISVVDSVSRGNDNKTYTGNIYAVFSGKTIDLLSIPSPHSSVLHPDGTVNTSSFNMQNLKSTFDGIGAKFSKTGGPFLKFLTA